MRGTLGGNLGEFGPLLLDLADGTLDGLFGGVAPLPPALISLGTDVNQGAIVPTDLRQTYAEFDPIYEADETIATLEFSHDFGALTLTSVTGYQETSFLTQTDYNWTVAAHRLQRAGGGGADGRIRRRADQRDRSARCSARWTAASATSARSRATTISRIRKRISGRRSCACLRSSMGR